MLQGVVYLVHSSLMFHFDAALQYRSCQLQHFKSKANTIGWVSSSRVRINGHVVCVQKPYPVKRVEKMNAIDQWSEGGQCGQICTIPRYPVRMDDVIRGKMWSKEGSGGLKVK